MTSTELKQKEKTTLPDEEQLIVKPAVTPKEAVAMWHEYQQLKNKIATEEDVQEIRGRQFYKKSYWRKIATFFNLSVEIMNEREEKIGDNIVFYFTCKATAPNKRFAIGTGSCDLFEKGTRNSFHNARSTAETRAFNRSISNLVGGGEVSAEEVTEDNFEERPQTRSSLCTCGTKGKYHALNCPARQQSRYANPS